jgi:hypothetical protein
MVLSYFDLILLFQFLGRNPGRLLNHHQHAIPRAVFNLATLWCVDEAGPLDPWQKRILWQCMIICLAIDSLMKTEKLQPLSSIGWDLAMRVADFVVPKHHIWISKISLAQGPNWVLSIKFAIKYVETSAIPIHWPSNYFLSPIRSPYKTCSYQPSLLACYWEYLAWLQTRFCQGHFLEVRACPMRLVSLLL